MRMSRWSLTLSAAFAALMAGALTTVAQECKGCDNFVDEGDMHRWTTESPDVDVRCDTAVGGHPSGCNDTSAHYGDCESRHPGSCGAPLEAALDALFAVDVSSVRAVMAILEAHSRFVTIDHQMEQLRVVDCRGRVVALIDLPRNSPLTDGPALIVQPTQELPSIELLRSDARDDALRPLAGRGHTALSRMYFRHRESSRP